MDAQQFLAEFGHIANAPGGIGKLRELVLHLAVSGKLTLQTLGEGADDYLDEIKSTQVALQLDGTIRVNKKIRSEKDQGGWQIPPNWLWCRLGELCSFSPGKTPPRKEGKYWNTGDYPWFSIADMSHGQVVTSSSETVSEEARTEVFKSEPSPIGSLLMSFKLSIGKLSLLGVPAYHNEAIITIEPFAPELKEYFFKCLNGFDLSAGNKAAIKGNTLNQDSLSNILVALPPKNEISRIIAKVNELMALCDKMEAQQQARRKLQNALRQSTLHAVASAISPHELQTTWGRLADNFGRLFYAPEDVDELRKTVLDLAVSGYLSNPDQLDEPSSTLKAKILAAKKMGIAGGSFSRKKHVKPEELEETTLPAHWETITLDEAISTIDAGWSPACLPNPRDDENKWGVLKTTAVQVLRFLPHEHKELPVSLDPRPQYQIEVGDILITRAGPKNRVGICCVVDTAPQRLMISDKLIRFHIVGDLINPRFVALCLSAGEPGRILERLKSGMADSQMNISQDKLRSITIPLPPIEEQRRTLEKIEALMKVIDSYGQRLRKENRLAEQTAAVSVSSLTGIAIEQEEEPMKAPQTELIAPLRLGATPDIKAKAPLATILARHNGEMSAKNLWQRFGGEIDAFYAQLKTEVAHGWIVEPVLLRLRPDLDLDTIPAEAKVKAQLVKLIKNSGGEFYENDLCEQYGRGLAVFKEQLKIEIGYNWIVRASAAEMRFVAKEKEIV